MCDGPVLLLYVPGDWEVVPDALAELRRYLSDEYGGTLEVRPATGYMPAPMPLYTGAWRRTTPEDLRPLIQAAFYTLDWLDLEDAG